MSDELFGEEVKFPDDLEMMLSMSVQYDKLQSIMKFMLDLLKRHETGLRMAFSKQNVIAPEILTLHSFKETLELKVNTLEKGLHKVSSRVEEVKTNIDGRGDTVETLKFLLNMITDHDTQILIYKKQIQELQEENVENQVRMKSFEEFIKETNKKFATEPSINHQDKHEISQASIKSSTSSEESKQKSQTLNYLAPSRRYRSNKDKKASNPPLTIDLPAELPLVNKESSPEALIQNSVDSISPSSANPNNNHLGKPTFKLTSPTPPHIKEMLTRINTIEKALESPPGSSEVKTRLGKLENLYKFVEGVLDSCEPLTIRNKDEILKIARQLKQIESDLTNKINTEEFDSIKSLVITLASGSPKYDTSSLFSSKDINTIRALERKVSELEVSLADVVKIYPENIEEVVLKLRRIEQKLQIKANENDIQELRGEVKALGEKYKTLSTSVINSKDAKTSAVKNNKPAESILIGSFNRRLSGFEELIRSLKIPSGIDLTHLWEEFRKICISLQGLVDTISDMKKYESLKSSDILSKIDKKADLEILKVMEEKIKKNINDNQEKLAFQFGEKAEMRRGFKYLEGLIKNIDDIRSKPEGDDAMLARKPLGGWSCGSCEKKLESLTGRIGHSPWGRMPLRDVSERMLKAGPGFSKMLTTLQLDSVRMRSDADDIIFPQVRNTERSTTPQP